jgi:hypothetical protein
MKKLIIILSVLIIVSLTGCSEGQVLADYGNTEDYKLPNVTRIVSHGGDKGYNYLIDNNTNVVYLEYQEINGGRAITVMFNKDGSVMTEKDIKKDLTKEK